MATVLRVVRKTEELEPVDLGPSPCFVRRERTTVRTVVVVMTGVHNEAVVRNEQVVTTTPAEPQGSHTLSVLSVLPENAGFRPPRGTTAG